MNSFNVETGLTIGGNYGLHDQLMAIRFIFENKSNLDCSRITLNGESAGAASGLTVFYIIFHKLCRFSFHYAFKRRSCWND